MMVNEARMEIDVVILSWNRLATTMEAISSVRRQVGVIAHLWVVDQGSEAGCVEQLRREAQSSSDLFLLELGRNIGVAAGRNRGMRLGRAECIVVLDNDAELSDPGCLARAAERFKADPGLSVIGFRIVNFRTGEDDRLSWAYPRSLRPRSEREFTAARYCGCGHAIRRSALAKTRGYDESLFFYWEELDLSYQLLEAGYRIVYDPSIVVRHKVDADARTDWSGSRFYYLVRNALYLDWKYYGSLRRIAARAAAYQIKGLYNGTWRQSGAALRDAAVMIYRARGDRAPLSAKTRDYVAEHDERHRGSLFSRLRNEVLEKLPGRA